MTWLADALLVLALGGMTLAVIGLFRMPDLYLRLHAAAAAVFPGLIFLVAAGVVVGSAALASRAALIAVLVVATSAMSAHAIAWAAHRRGEPLAPGSIDER